MRGGSITGTTPGRRSGGPRPQSRGTSFRGWSRSDQAAGLHLHFDVTRGCPDWGCQTIPVRFENSSGNPLLQGQEARALPLAAADDRGARRIIRDTRADRRSGRADRPGCRESRPGRPESYPSRRESYPDGRESYPDGRESYPGGPESYPDCQESYPDYRESFPDGPESYPDRRKSFPDGRESYPDGWESFPDGREGLPEVRGVPSGAARPGGAWRGRRRCLLPCPRWPSALPSRSARPRRGRRRKAARSPP